MNNCDFHVAILMSTYNGERYLREQLDSIIKQTYKNIEILIRDDGSIDSTIDILNEYRKKYKYIRYYTGPNLKPARSFLDLLRQAPVADYYAFCDQDDYWEDDKIECAIKKLKDGKADFYYSSYTVVNENLKTIREGVQKPVMNTIGQALVMATVTGCTVVFSKKVQECAKLYSPLQLMMHDSWLYKVTLAMGYKVVYDDQAHLLYRQHGNNVIGANKSKIRIWKSKWRRWLKNVSNDRYHEACELYKGYNSMMPLEQSRIVKRIADYLQMNLVKRILLAMNSDYKTGNTKSDIAFLFAIIFKRY